MPYAVRNSIVLAVLLILFSGAGGAYIYLHQEKKIEQIKKERAALQEELGDVRDLYNRLANVQRRVQTLTEAWRQRPKDIPRMESASATNAYLNRILAFCPELDLNVLTQEKVEQDGCGYVRYHLSGQGPFFSLARLIQYIEHGPKLMKLSNVDIREVHTLDKEKGTILHTVQFDADLLAYYTEQAPFADSSSAKPVEEVTFKPIVYNPFLSLVNPEIPPNVYDLPDVEKSTLLAVMKGRAFINDQHNQLVMLTEGDEVYLGYVSKIMPERRQVLFLLNKGGIVERYILTLRFQTNMPIPKNK
ncbi:MAG: hypothetical protein QHI48_09530 [Bacteroidota bacterium]|nr:hypothetical protein [Bacteroidota bacterium]